jgi:hypothetical protein
MTPAEFERRLMALDLTFERVFLKTRPRAIHWHNRKPGERGTLEATLEDTNLMITARRNSMGPWVEAAINHLDSPS